MARTFLKIVIWVLASITLVYWMTKYNIPFGILDILSAPLVASIFVYFFYAITTFSWSRRKKYYLASISSLWERRTILAIAFSLVMLGWFGAQWGINNFTVEIYFMHGYTIALYSATALYIGALIVMKSILPTKKAY
ncbi:hypothetical protein ONV78_14460 [Hahella sp. CR1]|uniref:hypothetical protein n=1 Tax=Hahella sp. CR1 TaxID=2992807 RepID=UPI002441CC19|nr:hypothetical protein [Hahella sp. CR1]MDG9668944.1 hypothetical protein [Hahella sp. CR1]